MLYRFADHGDRDVAMRYDLTVPLARVVAQHRGVLPHPFRRYQIAPVWRADKPQRGRFREFLQCDVDIVGSDAATADAEVLATGLAVLQALGIEGVRLHLNHRDLLAGLLDKAGVGQGSARQLSLRAIDKWEKIGSDGVRRELAAIDSLDTDCIESLMTMFSATRPTAATDDTAPVDHAVVFDGLAELIGPNHALDRLRAVTELVGDFCNWLDCTRLVVHVHDGHK